LRDRVDAPASFTGAAATRCAQQGAGAASSPGNCKCWRRSGSAPRPAPPCGRPRPGRIPMNGARRSGGRGAPLGIWPRRRARIGS